MPKKRNSAKVIFFSTLIVGIAIGFGGGFIFGKVASIKDIPGELAELEKIFSNEPTFALINEGVDVISKKYVDSDEVSRPDLIYGAMQGLMEALGDAYSVFLPPEEAKMFEDDIGGSFEGIGAEIGIREGVLTVISPLKNSPAEQAGLAAGDKILYVDDTETSNLTLEEAVRIIRGKGGTEVVLTVTRADVEEDMKISIIRDTIKIPNIEWEDKGDGIAYISLYHFNEKASSDFDDTISEIFKAGSDKIILDLRNNPGGFLEVAVDIAGWFVAKDAVVVIEDRGEEKENRLYKADGSSLLAGFPVVVLINKGSASASEILAGALRDHLGVKLVGETTFGKGSVQELVKLSDSSTIKITVAKWLTPKGISIQDNGLEPDVSIEMTPGIFNEEGDVQLEAAIELLKNL